jgi:hypothetical protein
MNINPGEGILRFNIILLLTCSFCMAALSFTDITARAGVAGPSGSAAGGHGAMWADITGDDLPDVYMPFNWQTQEYPDYLYINKGTATWSEEASVRGVIDRDGGSHGACWADLDNDGDYDLVNGTTLPYGGNGEQNDIYKNNGDGRFTEVTPASMENTREPTRGVCAFDMDKDGDLDIFCVAGWMGSGDPSGERNELYENTGNFNFTAHTSGPAYTCPAGQGCVDTDYDGDGDVDLIACNRDGDLNILRNDGGVNNFTKISPSSIGITHRAYSGVSTADIDNDGDLDLLIASDGSAWLYTNQGKGTFAYKRGFSGTDGYMGGFADLDNDTDLDLVFAGHGAVYLNDGSGAFGTGPSVPNASALTDPRAVAFADIDNDGDPDFIYAGKKVPNKLYRNNYDNTGNHWLKVRLVAKNGQAGAFGARVTVYAGAARIGLREAKSNYGYLGQDDPVLHFGLGPHTAVDVTAKFLDGTVITKKGVQANQVLTVDASQSTGFNAPGRTRTKNVLLLEPHPFSQSVTIALASESDISGARVRIFDVSGRFLEALEVSGSGPVRWHAGNRPSGVYLLKVNSQNQVFCQRAFHSP